MVPERHDTGINIDKISPVSKAHEIETPGTPSDDFVFKKNVNIMSIVDETSRNHNLAPPLSTRNSSMNIGGGSTSLNIDKLGKFVH